jgi:hypothetical protein
LLDLLRCLRIRRRCFEVAFAITTYRGCVTGGGGLDVFGSSAQAQSIAIVKGRVTDATEAIVRDGARDSAAISW